MDMQYTGYVMRMRTRDNNSALPLEGVLACIRFTQFYVNFSRQEHLIGIVQLLRISGFSLYPLSFILYIPFNLINNFYFLAWTPLFLIWIPVFLIVSLLFFFSNKCASRFWREPSNKNNQCSNKNVDILKRKKLLRVLLWIVYFPFFAWRFA